jgi:hypothetical protein
MQIARLLNYSLWGALVVGLCISGTGFADVWNKKTTIDINKSVELPGGVVLQPGQYVMKLAESPSNRHIVQVFNGDESHVYATILAIPNYRLKPADDTVITFHETPAGQPAFVRAWFYPGDNFGQEFAYPKDRANYLAKATGTEVPIAPGGDAPISFAATAEDKQVAVNTGSPEPEVPSRGEAVEPLPAEPATAQIEATAPARAEEGANQRTERWMAAQESPPTELPQTASGLPLLGLGGIFALAIAFAARLIAARQTS